MTDKKELKPIKLSTKTVNNIQYSLCETYLFYDIIAEGDIKELEKIKDKREVESHIMNKAIWGKPLIVINTSDDLEELKKEFEKI